MAEDKQNLFGEYGSEGGDSEDSNEELWNVSQVRYKFIRYSVDPKLLISIFLKQSYLGRFVSCNFSSQTTFDLQFPC